MKIRPLRRERARRELTPKHLWMAHLCQLVWDGMERSRPREAYVGVATIREKQSGADHGPENSRYMEARHGESKCGTRAIARIPTPFKKRMVTTFFENVDAGAKDAIRSVSIGKVGLVKLRWRL